MTVGEEDGASPARKRPRLSLKLQKKPGSLPVSADGKGPPGEGKGCTASGQKLAPLFTQSHCPSPKEADSAVEMQYVANKFSEFKDRFLV